MLIAKSDRKKGSRVRSYKIWQVGEGAVTLEIRPLGLAVIRANVTIISPGAYQELPRQYLEGVAQFSLDNAQVAALRSAPDATSAPYLAFLCDAFLAPSAPIRKWGWAMRFTRGGAGLPATLNDGTPLALDSHGFRTALRNFPAGAGVARGYEVISLA